MHFLLAFLLFAQTADEHPFITAQRAAKAYEEGKYADAAAGYERATRLLPRSISSKIGYARSLARLGRNAEAIAQLEAAVDYGVRFDANDEAFKPLKSDPRFVAVESLMRARSAPIVRGETAFLLEKDLIPENIAHDPKTGAFFVGSMYKAKIVKIARDGSVSDFVPARRDGLLSVLGMKVDVPRRELWAASGNFIDSPPLEVDDPASRGKGAIFRFDLDSGQLIRRYDGPGGTPAEPMWFNDLALAPNGDVYATAGGRGIWIVRRDGTAPEPFLAPPGMFFNGIAITPDGKTLFGASWVDGVIRIDTATKTHGAIEVPRGATLGGIDGLYVHGNSLVAVQNGTDPARVIRAWLDPEMKRVIRFAVLEQSHPQSDLPLTGTIVGDDLYYVARSQLRAFEKGKIWPMERLKETAIVRLPLELPGAPPADLAREREALLELHRGAIRAHIERDPNWLAESTGEELVSASRGKISRFTPDDTRKFFTSYFEGATYPQYEDVEPPIVRVSDDGSMAWVMSRMRVRRAHGGKEVGFVYAGVMIYEKKDGLWKRVANASTFE